MLELCGSCRHLGLEVVATETTLAAPLLEVLVGAEQPGPHRGGVDRLLEAVGELGPRGAATLPGRHLRRDGPPEDDRQLRHESASSTNRTSDGCSSP